jgi:hypothetical protein
VRRSAIGLAFSLALALASPAMAAKQPRVDELDAVPSGSVMYVWHGDPARGCAAVGVCDVSGSLVYTPEFLTLEGTRVGSRFLPGFLYMDSEQPSVIRVRRDPAAGDPGLCVDTAADAFLALTPTPLRGGRYRFDVDRAVEPPPDFSGGRCAGPRPNDVKDVFPGGTLDARQLGRRPAKLDLSGRKSFGAGPFSGEVISTLTATVGRAAGDSGSFSSGGRVIKEKPRMIRYLDLQLTYRIERVDGALTTAFSGLAPPLCEPLDSCGISGTIDYMPSVSGGTIGFESARVVHGRPHVTLRRTLRELHSGRLFTSGIARYKSGAVSRVSARVARPGESDCVDAGGTSRLALLEGEGVRTLRLRLGPPEYDDGVDALRTHCAGPAQADVLAGGPVAAADLPIARLGARTLDITLARPGAFAAHGYGGTRSGQIQLHLMRTSARARVVAETFGG